MKLKEDAMKESELAATKWIKEVERSTFWSLYSFSGLKTIHLLLLLLIVAILIVVGIWYGVYMVPILGIPASIAVGAVYFFQGWWCVRRAWELEEKARQERDKKVKEEIKLAATMARDYRDVNVNWAFTWFAFAATIVAVIALLGN